MDSYTSHSRTAAASPPGNTHHHQPASTSELMSSAKFMADAAKSAFRHEGENVDKAKVAGAAADLLGAAKHYGKLEEKSFGKYVGKAEDYLHKYHSSHSSTTTTMHTASAPGAGSTTYSSHSGHGSVDSSNYVHEGSQSHASSGGGGKYGDYIKLAQGILKKH